MLDDRPQGPVEVVGRALSVDALMRLAAKLVDQRPQNARLADAWLSDEQYTLAFTALGLLPPGQQQVDLLIAPDNGGNGRSVPLLESAGAQRLAHDAKRLEAGLEAFGRPELHGLEEKRVAEYAARLVRDEDCAGRGVLLEARR